MDARTLRGCVRRRRETAGTVIDMWGRGRGRMFMSYEDRKKERHQNVLGLVPSFAAALLEQDSFNSLWCWEMETKQHPDKMLRLLPSDVGSFFRSAAASDQNYDVLFSYKNCPTLLPPWGNFPFSVYRKWSFGIRARISEVCGGGNLFVNSGKITGKGGEVIHIISHHCWRKGFVFKAAGNETVDEGPMWHDTGSIRVAPVFSSSEM